MMAVPCDIGQHVGDRLRRRRKLLGLTQAQVAAAVGTTFQQVCRFECGGARVDVSQLWSLAGALGVTTGYFFEGLAPVSMRSAAAARAVRALSPGPS